MLDFVIFNDIPLNVRVERACVLFYNRSILTSGSQAKCCRVLLLCLKI